MALFSQILTLFFLVQIMKIEDTLKKKLQGIDNGRVRGRLKGNFGYMRSDEIARVQEMKKRTKNSLGHLLVLSFLVQNIRFVSNIACCIKLHLCLGFVPW